MTETEKQLVFISDVIKFVATKGATDKTKAKTLRKLSKLLIQEARKLEGKE